MLSSIAVKNLRCFDDSVEYKVPLTKETVFMGPNNAGKSAIFTALNLFRTSWRDDLNYFTDFYRLDSYYHAVHKHDVNRNIEIALEFKEEEDETHRYRIEINGNKIIRRDYSQNDGTVQDFLTLINNDQRHENRVNSLWYISPIRNSILSSTNVTGQGLTLQQLHPTGQNLTQFLLEKNTAEDPQWGTLIEWLKKIDPEMDLLKTPLSGQTVKLETDRTYQSDTVPIALGHQGNGTIINNLQIFLIWLLTVMYLDSLLTRNML